MAGRTSHRRPDAEQVITAFAARQHGVVTRAQLLGAGVAPDVIDRRVKARRLRRLQRGVYLVGPLMAPHTRAMAAVLSCGDSAVLSHHAAAAHWQMTSCLGENARVEVIVARGRSRSRPEIRVYHMRTLRPDEVTKLDGIPITKPARTLYDLASVLEGRELERALAEAIARRLTSRSRVLSLLARYPRRPGTKKLQSLLDGDARPARTRSEAEERFLTLIRRAQIREPEVNVIVEGYEVDFYWRAERLVVEIDGRAFHRSDRSFESDRRRDAVLVAAGLRVMRLTWHQLVRESEPLLVRLAQALVRPTLT